MKIDLNDDQTLFAVVFGGMTAAFVAVIIVLSALSSINDNIKYNRYKEALQEYKKCAKDFTDSFDVETYCGDAPSSIMML